MGQQGTVVAVQCGLQEIGHGAGGPVCAGRPGTGVLLVGVAVMAGLDPVAIREPGLQHPATGTALGAAVPADLGSVALVTVVIGQGAVLEQHVPAVAAPPSRSENLRQKQTTRIRTTVAYAVCERIHERRRVGDLQCPADLGTVDVKSPA